MEGLLDAAEILLDIPRPIDPSSMGFDVRTMGELTPIEKDVARQLVFQRLGIDPNKLEEYRTRQYTTFPVEDVPAPGEIKAEVYRTNTEDIFLQELTFPDGEKRWLLGPDQDI